MPLRTTIFLTILGLAATPAALAQHTLISGNPLTSATVSLLEGESTSLPALTDGSDLSVCKVENASSVAFIFNLSEQWQVKGINIVSGSDTDCAPNRMTLYGRNSESDDWASVGSYRGISFKGPYTPYTGKALSSAKAYSSFKLEITKIKASDSLELAEVQLLGTPANSGSIALNENGQFSASDNAENLWAADGSNLTQPVIFKNAKAEYGLVDTWIQYSFDTPTAISGYGLVSSSVSSQDTRPTSWELLASDDGEHWHGLDLRCNASNLTADNYLERHELSGTSEYIDFAAVADHLHEIANRDFYRTWGTGKYLIHAWNPDPSKINTGYNYWWMAHAIDAYIDAFVRTGDSKYQSRARMIRQGMYTAYDASRQDLWNSFFDDMEWMNLACIRGYENLTVAQEKWLEEAIQLFDWIWEGWNYDNGSEGGIRWNSGTGTGKNSCSNAPAIIGAAKLYQLTGEEHYLEKAKMIYNWMLTHSRFDDGFIKDAPDNEIRGWAFTYNQGTWVGGLLELYKITGDREYYDVATDLLDKTVYSRWYTPDGIMRENGASDGGLFKGIYIRYITNWVLSGLLDEERQLRYTRFLVENARSMYNCALIKDGWKVMPDWKHRDEKVNGENNGGEDGSYHSSILLSGMFLCESMDMMRRAGLLNDDYSVKDPSANHKYSHYRVNFLSNAGSSNMQIGAFTLYPYGESGVDATEDISDVAISSGKGFINVIAPQDSAIKVFTIDGRCISDSSGESLHFSSPSGIYVVNVITPGGLSTSSKCKI